MTDAPTLRALAAAAGDEEQVRLAALRRRGIERLTPTLSADLAALMAKIGDDNSISSQSVRSVLASANEAIPKPNATITAWSEWLGNTSGRALRNALAELSRDTDEYGVVNEVKPWLIRYFRDVAAMPESHSTDSDSTSSRVT